MNCKNCNTSLAASDKFCNECGAKCIDTRLTVKYLLEESKESFFSIDSNKPLRTFIDMFKRPDQVIDGYINGVRKKYINAFGYFTLALTLSSFFFFVFLKWYPNLLDFTMQSGSLPETVSEEQLKIQTDVTKKIFEYSSLMFFLTIPLTALISRLVFLRNKKYNYAEHLIINLYTYSHVSIVTTILYFLTIWNQTLFTTISFSAILIQILFYFYVLKKLYKLSFGKMLLKLILFLFILGLLMTIITIIGVVIGFASGGFDGFIEEAAKQKELKGTSYINSSFINWTS